jgi:hypothetical protein
VGGYIVSGKEKQFSQSFKNILFLTLKFYISDKDQRLIYYCSKKTLEDSLKLEVLR